MGGGKVGDAVGAAVGLLVGDGSGEVVPCCVNGRKMVYEGTSPDTSGLSVAGPTNVGDIRGPAWQYDRPRQSANNHTVRTVTHSFEDTKLAHTKAQEQNHTWRSLSPKTKYPCPEVCITRISPTAMPAYTECQSTQDERKLSENPIVATQTGKTCLVSGC